KNNSGKSNIIRALNIILGEKLPGSNTFQDSDFHFCKNQGIADELFIAIRLVDCDLDQGELDKVKYIREYRFGKDNWLNYNHSCEFDLTDFFKEEIDQLQKRDFDSFGERYQVKQWGKSVNELVLYVYAKRDEDANIE